MGEAQGCGQFKGGAPGILGERAVEARRDPRREGRGPLRGGRGRPAGGPGQSATEGGRRASELSGWLAPPGGVGLSGGAGRLGRWRAGLRGMGRAERGQTGGEAGRGGAGPVSRVLGRAWAERNWAAKKKGWAHAGEKGHGQGMGWTGLGVWAGLRVWVFLFPTLLLSKF